ncbi:GGDEF domain-containing protein [Salinivibrio sp. ES.052]|uniref:GGDEF domain-containing protein n=1 Tax=Salinivibrio sp. ES.052 TaxID=1882823 RepID=UPI0009285835|nr:GGDEF domain-containing protein [Salinivibrio sp. ES.052]SIO33048.1 hypothetical protein SAMN05444724_2737 [Salinivibrio sp. ES.052]
MGLLRSSAVRVGTPIFLLLLLTAGYHPLIASLAPYYNLIYAAPYFLLLTALLLSHLFKSARVGMMVVILLVGYTVILTRLQSPLDQGTTYLEYLLLAVALPINLLYMIIVRDQKLTSRFGLFFFFAIGMEMGWCALMVQQFGELSNYLHQHPILVRAASISPMPLLLIVLLCILVCMSTIRLLHKNSIEDHAAFISVLCGAATLVFFNVPFISSLIFSLAGLLLVANQVSFSHQLAFVDGLTEIAGRRALEDELKHLGRQYTLAMLDVDHFKQFNDRYGHETGDDVLKLVAKQMALCDGGASAFRYGGEEFTLLFKGKMTEHCLPYLEALREDIANYPLVLRDQSRPYNDKQGRQKRGRAIDKEPVNITVSIGFADSSQADTPDEVLQLADSALYKAKEAGRNCIKGST